MGTVQLLDVHAMERNPPHEAKLTNKQAMQVG